MIVVSNGKSHAEASRNVIKSLSALIPVNLEYRVDILTATTMSINTVRTGAVLWTKLSSASLMPSVLFAGNELENAYNTDGREESATIHTQRNHARNCRARLNLHGLFKFGMLLLVLGAAGMLAKTVRKKKSITHQLPITQSSTTG